MGASSKVKKAFSTVKLFKDWPTVLRMEAKAKLGGMHEGKNGAEQSVTPLSLRDGTKLLIRPNTQDFIVVWEIFINETYSGAKGLSQVLPQIGQDDVVVDIGAHIGIFAVYAARKARNGTIFAFEPDAGNYGMLTRNLAANPAIRNIRAHNQAIWSSEGKRNLFKAEEYWSGGHSLFENWMDDYSASEEGAREAPHDSAASSVLEVDCTTIPKVVAENKLERIDFLKVDCEGSEYEILLNLPPEVFRKIRSICLEYHAVEGYTGKDLADRLESLGYAIEMWGNDVIGYMNATLRDGASR